MITVYINDKEVKTEPGKLILEVAKEQGIEIPTLCHDDELKPYGSCWVCAVKVEGRRGLVTSCGTEVVDGMKITTNSEEVIDARKMALELLLSNHYADCEAPCKIACPNKVDIQAYVSLIANGKYHEATKVIKETLPMPLSIGRVCPAFCEEECRRSIVDDPIAIRQLKRHAADFDLNDDWSYIPPKEKDKGKKVAIIGAGPSGLTCGYFLTNKGYDVDVFEASPKAGGWLRYGIPEYRLPKAILDQEIELMCKNGMKIHTNKKIGDDVSIQDLSKDYDAVYLALGAQNAVPMRVAGSDLDGIFLGVDFLKDFTLGKEINIGKKVAVVGGGNTAIDCARTAVRMGADTTIIYRRTRKEMPAEAYEVDAAEEEGVKFFFLTNPVEFTGDGKLETAKLEKMELGEPDASGRRRPQPTGEYIFEQFDSVIAAISQAPDVDFLKEEKNFVDGETIPLSRWNTIEVDEKSMYLGKSNIFGGGDFRRGPATAIEAIYDGRIASYSIEKYLLGLPVETACEEFNSSKGKKVKDVSAKEFESYEKIPRAKMPELDHVERRSNFDEVETGFADEEARKEAARCLECGCQENQTCVLRKYATDYVIAPAQFDGMQNKYEIDKSHPFITRDANKCVNCGRCIRTCSEIQGAGVLGYIGRGFDTTVAPEFGFSLTTTECESCGKCIEVCPVGALTAENVHYKMNPRLEDRTIQSCGLCGTGCKIEVVNQTDSVVLIKTPEEEPGINGRNLCFSGRFGWQIFNDENKLSAPVIKDGSDYKEIEWKEIPQLLKAKISEATSKSVIISPKISNEEMLIAKEIAEKIGATVSTLSTKVNFSEKLWETSLPYKVEEDIQDADTLVLIGEISHTLRTICRLEQRKGKKLIIIDNKDSKFNEFADVLINNDTPENLLKDLIKDSSKLGLTNNTLFIYNEDLVNEETIWNTWRLAADVCDFTSGSGVYATSIWANRNGLRFFNIDSNEFKPADFVMFFGELPNEDEIKLLAENSFVVRIDTHKAEKEVADLLIPQASYLERSGSVINDRYLLGNFDNPCRSSLFDLSLQAYANTELISPLRMESSVVENAFEKEFVALQDKKEMSKDELINFLESNKPSVKAIRNISEIQKIKIADLKCGITK